MNIDTLPKMPDLKARGEFGLVHGFYLHGGLRGVSAKLGIPKSEYRKSGLPRRRRGVAAAVVAHSEPEDSKVSVSVSEER